MELVVIKKSRPSISLLVYNPPPLPIRCAPAPSVAPSGFGDVQVVTKSQDRPLPEWIVQLQRKGVKQELQRATVRNVESPF